MNGKDQLIQAYQDIRKQTEALCRPLAIEDYVIQSVEDVSPPKWHLAHTTWFFETFILVAKKRDYSVFNPTFHYLFNSYYQSMGHPYPRMRRGILSRPTVDAIYDYRKQVDQAIIEHINSLSDSEWERVKPILTLGLHHEQQHQELLLMDIKHNFSYDPDYPVYQSVTKQKQSAMMTNTAFMEVEGGLVEVGHQGQDFCFDNELPRHQQFLKPYQIASRLITNGEYCEFMEAGGYAKPALWLADGWDAVQKNHWGAPLYWQKIENKWYVFSLSGLQEIDMAEPVTHVSYYEADAYACWRGMRLPSEMEWEHVAAMQEDASHKGNFLESNYFHPRMNSSAETMPQQMFGDVWEWTQSAYSPYPGYQALDGALGEYNGKFMSNQMVLRGGCCVTPQSHVRATYRNFFQPDKRWQFSGIRLASHI